MVAPVYIPEDSKVCGPRKRLNLLFEERREQGWDDHWKDIVDFCMPGCGRYLIGNDSRQDNDGRKKNGNIINSCAVQSLGVLAAGLRSGRTSPSSPWFNLSLPDEDLAEFRSVKEWLHEVRNIILGVMAKSNFYRSMHYLYRELGGFGTGAMLMEEDMQAAARCKPLTAGEYALALDSFYRPSALYRKFRLRAWQIREAFGKGSNKLENLPLDVQIALSNGQVDQMFEVGHAIEKNPEIAFDRADWRGMKYRSLYFPLHSGLRGNEEEIIYREGGYSYLPFIAPRWDAIGVDTYGRSPGMMVLGDQKALQREETLKLMGLDKMVRPPMVASADLRDDGVTTIAGEVTWVDPTQLEKGFRQAQQIAIPINEIRMDIDLTEKRIKEGFFYNLFFAVLSDDKKMTAYEVAKRYEEKATVLGPVFDSLDEEANEIIVNRYFDICHNLRLLPPPPPDLPQGMELKVEYISLLSKAQKAVETATIDQLFQFTALAMKMKPDAIDKVNVEEGIEQYAEGLGVVPKVIRSEDEMDQVRQAGQKMKMAQMAAATMQPVADAVNKLGNTPMQGGQSTALDEALASTRAAMGG